MTLGDYSEAVYTLEESVNAEWVLISAAFILLMQIGTALFNAGSTSKRST